MNIIRLGEGANHDGFLPSFLRHFLGHICIEVDLTHSGARRGIDTLGKELAFLLSLIHRSRIILRVKQ